jgi:hypothetical protein
MKPDLFAFATDSVMASYYTYFQTTKKTHNECYNYLMCIGHTENKEEIKNRR